MAPPSPELIELQTWFEERAEETGRRMDALESEIRRRLQPSEPVELPGGRAVAMRTVRWAAFAVALLAAVSFWAGYLLARY